MRTSNKMDGPRGVTELRKGLYLIRVQRRDPRTGQSLDIRRKVACANVREATMKQAELLAEMEQAAPLHERVQLRDYARSWLSSRLPTLKPSTRARYADDLDRHILPELGDYFLDAMAPEDVHRWFATKAATYAGATANGCLRLLKTVIADAVAQHNLPRDPTRRIRAVPERRRGEQESDDPVNLLTANELGRFLAVLQTRWPHWYAMVFTQFATARRFGEVSALRWEDIDEERGIIRIRRAQWRTIVSTTKTDRPVNVPLTEELRLVLRDWRQHLLRGQHRHLESGWVFPSKVGRPHHSSVCMRKAFADCLKEVGVSRGFSSHGLRRTANDLLRRIATGEVTRAITGHVTAAMTEHYSHVDAGEKKVAVEGMLRLVRSATQPVDPSRHPSRHRDPETGIQEKGR